MKKASAALLVLLLLLSLLGCGRQDEFEVRITIPAGTQKEFVYPEDFMFSDMEISPTKGKVVISSGAGLPDTQVVLKPVEAEEENAYEPVYLTPGMDVTIDAEKGAWFKIGVAVENPAQEDLVVYVKVKNVEARIE